jgi:hypothetical protein
VGGAVDQSTVTVTQGATTQTYEFDSNNACTAAAGKACVTIASGATGPEKAAALANAIAGNGASLVTATASGNQVILAAKTKGELTASPIALAVTTGLSRSAANLVEGHDLDLWSGNSNDTSVRRYLTSGGPFSPGTAHGAFTTATRQEGIAVRDVWAGPSANLQDLVVYAAHNQGGARVNGYAIVTTGNPLATATTQRFSVNATTIGTNVNFTQLFDVVLAPNGCLLVADQNGGGTGNIFAIDTRTATNASPSVERLVRNLSGVRGLGIDPLTGDLLIASTFNAVLRLTPTASTADCF